MGPFDGMHALVAMLPLDARARIIGQYRAGLDDLITQAGDLLNGANPADAQAPVHKLAGSAALMRDENLSGMLREIENFLRAGEVVGARAVWPFALAAAGRTRAALEIYVDPPQVDPAQR